MILAFLLCLHHQIYHSNQYETIHIHLKLNYENITQALSIFMSLIKVRISSG